MQLKNLETILPYIAGRDQNILPGTNSETDKHLIVRRFQFSTTMCTFKPNIVDNSVDLTEKEANAMIDAVKSHVKSSKKKGDTLQKVIVWKQKLSKHNYCVRGFVQV